MNRNILTAVIFFCFSTALVTQANPDHTIGAEERIKVIEQFRKSLIEFYVFPEVAKNIDKELSLKNYDSISSSQTLAKRLTDDVYQIAKDKHLRVQFSEKSLPPDRPIDKDRHRQAPDEEFRKISALHNFDFKKVACLPGNIGLIQFDAFRPIEWTKEVITTAMNFVQNTDALIFDIRENHGGEPGTIAFLSSYLFDENPVHLNDLYWRSNDSTQQFWTLRDIPGKRYSTENPIYIVTSENTGSAAEEFSYNLKTLKRATIVGETTWGGANPGDVHRLSEHFSVFIPNGRAINPITHTNWEGVGVQPDVKVKASDALRRAYKLALQANIERSKKDRDKTEWLKKVESDLDKGKLLTITD